MITDEQSLRDIGITEWSLEQCKYACNNLPCFLQDKPKAEKLACLLAILLSEPFERSYIVRKLNKATGYSLDIIGGNNLCDRNGRNDADYKIAIREQKHYSATTTTAEFVMAYFKRKYNCNQCFYNEEKYNTVALYVSFNEEPTGYDFSDIKKILAAGIGLKIYYTIGNQVISVLGGADTRYGVKLYGNGHPIIANGSYVVVSKFTCIEVV